MAYARSAFPGNGTNRLFNVNFPYISQAHVEVFVDSVEQDFTWINATTVELATAPTSGAVVIVRRNTPKDARLVDWTDGSNLREADLDLADLQSLYIAQEAFDLADQSVTQDQTDGALDAKGARLKNLADPVNDQDAATRKFVTDRTGPDVLAAANSAAASAAAAQAAAAQLTIPVTVDRGGTGGTTAAQARTSLGLGSAATVNVGSAPSDVPTNAILAEAGGVVFDQAANARLHLAFNLRHTALSLQAF